MNKAAAAKEVSIQKITIKLGAREITLEIEEAKKLKEALAELFGKAKEVVREEHHYHDRWSWPAWFHTPQYTWEIKPYVTGTTAITSTKTTGVLTIS